MMLLPSKNLMCEREKGSRLTRVGEAVAYGYGYSVLGYDK